MTETELLDRVAVDQVLAKLKEGDRCMMLLIFNIELPEDWGSRAVTYSSIGAYIGRRFEGKALPEATIRYRHQELVKYLRGERGELRRLRRD